jgi:hypothetical protein
VDLLLNELEIPDLFKVQGHEQPLVSLPDEGRDDQRRRGSDIY